MLSRHGLPLQSNSRRSTIHGFSWLDMKVREGMHQGDSLFRPLLMFMCACETGKTCIVADHGIGARGP